MLKRLSSIKIWLAVAVMMLPLAHSNAQQARYFEQPIESRVENVSESWKVELIPFPLDFAPDIKLIGDEELLFAPEMYDADSENFFSYVFVWQVKSKKLLSVEQIEADFYRYYDGLYQAVAKQVSNKTLSIRVSGSNSQGTGSIHWVEPFVTKQPQKLQFIYTQKQCELNGEVQLYVQVSPQPNVHPIWQQMSEIKTKGCH
ncbi:hypothetical protein ACFSJY_17635 [Thalassotalea euphylliae]|uniref:hypothetical protein n=1 Tax=Thalassotalea euphylliae TaxID=1655234 RepID=UPI003632772C